MTGATLCSGIGAPEQAMPWVDWKWCAEIEAFPSAVLSHHRPNVPNLGDMTAPDFIDRAAALGPLDLIVAGTPCQAFSVAGLRKSLADARGNLTLRFVEILDALNPRITLWENVPGVLNTSDNAFGCFLGALVGADSALVPATGQRWTDAGVVVGPARVVAWRVLDAQYFGLAQRRERVFVVASPRDGIDPAEVLFEREGVQRYFAPRREAGPAVTALTSNGVGTCGADDNQAQGGHLIAMPEISMCLNAGGMKRIDGESETFIAHALPILEAGADAGDIAPTLRSMGHDRSHANGGGQVAVAGTLAASGAGTQRPAGNCNEPDFCVPVGMAVRRLTPTECERLQGFPDGHTAITFRGKEAADGPRYKALGNSMAVPVIRWIGDRIRRTACAN